MKEELEKEKLELDKQIKSLEATQENTANTLKFYKSKLKLVVQHLKQFEESPKKENALSKTETEKR
jgi:hypothetical protein